MELTLRYEELYSVPEQYERLYDEAVVAAKSAYAPYSCFSVGVALLMNNGIIIKGSNQENVAYPAGLCAERVALNYATSEYPNIGVKALLLVAFNGEEQTSEPISPCGSCRQVIAEVVKRFNDFEVVMVGTSKTIITKASNLLPFSFSMPSF